MTAENDNQKKSCGEIIGQNMKKILKEKKITYSAFAEMLDVSTLTVAKWTAGSADKMKVEMFFRVAQALGTTMDVLLMGVNE